MQVTPEHWQHVKKVLAAALEREPAKRAAYLDQVCAEPSLRREVESLIAAHEQGDGSFIEHPAVQSGTLKTGTKLGTYEILSPLGAGGMGEVYQAHDSKLRRDVAIKVLPAAFVNDPERLSRFQREARMLASLNHPNIATIYGLEQSDGVNYLVMELVPGHTLADQVRPGPVPIKEALAIARQIAEALEAAHERGVIHRDLKPANVKVTPEGKVKVLDFGLAKAFANDGGLDLSLSPTLTGLASEEGRILGTPAYMSPEQARGKPVDKRTDVWAFGCVLYELLTTRQAFRGETVQDTIVTVLEREPDWQALHSTTPTKIHELLRRCLQKDRQRRLRDIGDARIEIEEALSTPAPGVVVAVASTAKRLPVVRALVIGMSALIGIVGIVTLVILRQRSVPVELSIPLEATVRQLTSYGGHETSGALAPDGKHFAFVSDMGGTPDIWVRQVSGGDPVQITHDEAAENDLVYAPDGESIYFFADGAIWNIGALGGHPRKIISGARFPAPSADGKRIAFTRSLDPVFTGSAFEARAAIEIANSDGTQSRRIYEGPGLTQVSWSPDGRWLAFTEGQLFDVRHLYVVDVNGQNKRTITVPPHDKSITAQTWFPDSRRLVVSKSYEGSDALSNADLGVTSIDYESNRRLTLNGNAQFTGPSLSSDGSRLLVTSTSNEREVWRVPLSRDANANGAAAVRILDSSWDPMWTQVSDMTLLINSSTTGSRNLWTLSLDRSGVRRQITLLSGGTISHAALSRDGRRVAYSSAQGDATKIWVMNTDGSNPMQLTEGPGQDFWPTWSPDGRWIAFGSTRGGHPETWKIPSAGGQVVRISPTGGRNDWSPTDNRIAYYDWVRDRVNIVDADTGKMLLDVPVPGSFPGLPVWSPDGRRFSLIRSDGYLADAIWIFDAALGHGRIVAKFPGRFHIIFRAGWSSDGLSLIVNRVETVSHIVILEHF